MLTSATRGETLTPNPNECNFTLTSVTGCTHPYPDTYIYKCSLVAWNLGSPKSVFACMSSAKLLLFMLGNCNLRKMCKMRKLCARECVR